MTGLLEGMDWHPLWVTARVAVAATAISLVAGSLLALLLVRRKVPGRRFLESAVLLPLVLPPTVLGYYLLVLLGRGTPVGRAWEAVFGGPLVFTLGAAVVAACASTIPLVARQMIGAFAVINSDILEAARMDGAGWWRLLWNVELPLVAPALRAAGAIAFARATGDFGATIMLAGNIPGRTQTASVAIYDLMNAGRDGQALVLVLVVTVIAVTALFATGSSKNGTTY